MDKKTLPSWELEEAAHQKGYALVCGCDEAGAGPLAGPVYAGAVILPEGLKLPYLNDSKQVTPKRRDALFDEIIASAVAWAVASVSLAIDKLAPAPDYALIDGNRDKGKQFALVTPHETVLKGDGRSLSIAAASILAKVSRDRTMEELAEQYPEYRFEQHKGYGTKLHYAMLDRYGPSPVHRRTFLKKWEAARHG